MIHPTAYIDPGASVAEGVAIGPFCRIGKGAVIRSGAVLQAHVILNGPVTLEENVRLFSFVKIGNGTAPVTVGANTHIREFCQIGNQEDDTVPLTIGKDNFIMAYVQLHPGVTLGEACILTNTVTLQKHVACEEKVIVGGLSTVEAGNTIGTGVMVGGASYIDRDMPPFCLVEGNHATVKGLNIIGLRRRFENKEDIEAVKTAYKEIFRGGVDKEKASAIAESGTNPHAVRLAAFVSSSNM
jgi:UDP-N-acetylglucosamine acyltransferase